MGNKKDVSSKVVKKTLPCEDCRGTGLNVGSPNAATLCVPCKGNGTVRKTVKVQE